MGRHAFIPPELKRRPFTIEDAYRAGLTKRQLASRAWNRIGPRTYVWSGLTITQEVRLAAALLRVPPDTVVGGWAAAALQGHTIDPETAIQAVIPTGGRISGKAAMTISRRCLPEGDVVTIGRWPVTSMPRTLRDLCAGLDLTEAVVLVDEALHLGTVRLAELKAWIAARAGTTGIARLRQALAYAEPLSESPMESRLRMLLVLRGLPRPAAQVEIRDPNGLLIGRPDLYYAAARLGLEYDGQTHRHALAEDNRRQNRLQAAGVRLLRFTRGDIFGQPDRVAAQVRSVLAA